MLLLWHFAEEDENHEKIMGTKRKLMDDEEYEPEDAIRYAIRKRRYLIQKQTETGDENYTSQEGGSDSESPDSGEETES